MKKLWIVSLMVFILALVGCKDEPLATQLVYQGGQVGLIMPKSKTLEGSYLTYSGNATLYYSSFSLENQYDNTINFGSGGSIPLKASQTNYADYIENSIEILGCNIKDSKLTVEFKTGTDYRGVYNTFRLRGIYLKIGNDVFYAKESPEDEKNEALFFGHELLTDYRYDYRSSRSFTFELPSKYSNCRGKLLPYEKEYNLPISGEEVLLTNESYISFEANITENQVISESLELAIETEGILDIKTYLNGFLVDNNIRFDKEAWAEGAHKLVIRAQNSKGFVALKEIPFSLEGGKSINQSVSFEAKDLGYLLDYPTKNATGITIEAEGYIKDYSPVSIIDITVPKTEEFFMWSGKIIENGTAFLQVYDSHENKFITLSTTKEINAQLGYNISNNQAFLKATDTHFQFRVGVVNVETDYQISHQIFHLTDVQYITRNAASTIERTRKAGEEALQTLADYLIDETNNANLVYTIATGDFTQSLLKAEEEFEAVTNNLLYPLLDADVAFGVVSGNHDIGALSENPNSNDGSNSLDEFLVYEHFGKYLGEDIFNSKPYYGGSFEDNRSHYDLFSINGHDFMALYLGWGSSIKGIHVSEKDINWAKTVLEMYPNRTVMIGVHEYLNALGVKTATGEFVYSSLVVNYDNIKFVFSGHINGSNYRVDLLDDNKDGINDRAVMQILTNFQEEEALYGATFLRRIGLDFENNKMLFSLYSPYMNDHKIFVNTNMLFVNQANNFIYDFNLNQSAYSFETIKIGK